MSFHCQRLNTPRLYQICHFTVKDWTHLVYITHVLALSKIEHTSFISDMSFHCQRLNTPRLYQTCPFTVKDWTHLVDIRHVLSVSKIEHTSFKSDMFFHCLNIEHTPFISDMSFHCQLFNTPHLYLTCPFTVKDWTNLVYIRHVLRDFQCKNIKHFEKGQR